MSVTLLWRTDVHLSDYTPRSRRDDWTETVLGKLAQVGEIAKEEGALAVLDGGDFFDIKSPTRNSHSLVRRVAEVHRAYPCPVYGNVGNHDCVYGDYAFLHQQPLGVLFESGVFRRCYDEHEAVFTWVGDATKKPTPSLKVRVVGVPYHGTSYDLERFRRIRKGDEDYLVVIAHVLASPSGGSMFESEDVIRYSDLDEFEGDVFFFGHWHRDQGVVRTEGGKWVVNVGSMTRGSISQDDLDRKPSVVRVRFDKDGVDFKKIVLRHLPIGEAFDLEARDLQSLREGVIEEFVDSIQPLLRAGSEKSVRDSIRELSGVPDLVKEKAILYVEKAGG